MYLQSSCGAQMRANTLKILCELWGFLPDFYMSWFLNYEKILILFETVEYSKCDKESYASTYIQNIFCHWYSTGHGECLLDKPNGRIYDLSSQLPGLMYDVNKQCELMFGPGSQVCPYLVRKNSVLFFFFSFLKNIKLRLEDTSKLYVYSLEQKVN